MSNRRFAGAAAIALGFLVLSAGAAPAREPIRDEVRAGLLDRINRDRARHGLPAVALEPDASRIADDYCGIQVETGTRGHFSTDGLAPYMRYSFAGLHDGVLENAAAWSAREVVPEERIGELAQRSHSEMIAEIPPNDGHRRAILDPHATHVGIGVSWGGREVRIVEVLLRRYLEWETKKQKGMAGETYRYEARLLDPSTIVDSITIHFEPFPFRLTRERANSIDSYRLPQEWIRLERRRAASRLDAATRERPDAKQTFELHGDRLSFDLGLTSGRGIYTIVVWARRPGDRRPFAATNLSVVADQPGRHASSGFQ